MKNITYLLITLVCLTSSAEAVQIEDDLDDNSATSAMTNGKPIDLQAVQAAFTKSDPMANTLTVSYVKGKVTKIYVREFMDTHIILPEKIKDFSLGDPVNFFWKPAAAADNRGRIYFRNYNADTNLTLFGESDAAYVFYIRAIDVNSEHLPFFTVFMENPDLPAVDIKLNVKAATSHDAEPGKKFKKPEDGEYLHKLTDVELGKLNFNYEVVGGNDSLAPIRVFDDGMFTYFQFGDDSFDFVQRLPVVYAVIDGFDNPVNTRKPGGSIVAEMTNDKWTLRHGGSHLCIHRVGK